MALKGPKKARKSLRKVQEYQETIENEPNQCKIFHCASLPEFFDDMPRVRIRSLAGKKTHQKICLSLSKIMAAV